MTKAEIIELVKQGQKIVTCRGSMGMKPACFVGQIKIRRDTAIKVIRELGMVTNDKYAVKSYFLPEVKNV